MYVKLYEGSYFSGSKSMTSSKSVVLLRTRLLLSFKPPSDKARLFRPLLATLLHVVNNDAVVCWWEQLTRLVVMLQTAVWCSSISFKMSMLSFDASVAQEQYFCRSLLVLLSTGLAEKRLFGEVNWILQNNSKRQNFGKIKFDKWYFKKLSIMFELWKLLNVNLNIIFIKILIIIL